jgi:hypothetical protein
MKTKQLAQLIRRLVKEEVRGQVRALLLEQSKTPTAPIKTSKPEARVKQKYTSNDALNDILNETVQTTGYDTLKTFDASDARAGFASMQGPAASSPIPDKDISGAPMNPNKITPDLMSALTRDYTALVKRF